MQPRTLRGRSESMERALSVVRAAGRHGSGGVVLVSGAAGIGKTALLTEVCRQAGRLQVRPALGTCDPIEQVSPGAPLITPLRSGRDPLITAEEYRNIVAARHEPLLLVEAVASALERAASEGPILIALDDVQWVDRVSAFVVRGLLSRLLGLPVVWLLATRDDSADVLGAVQTRLEHIRLAPLGAADLAAIARDRLGRPPDERTRRFLDASAGNALLAVDVLDNLTRAAARGEPDTVPEEFGAAIAGRLAALPDQARALVEVVAVGGRPLTVHEALRFVQEPGGRAKDGFASDRSASDGRASECSAGDGPGSDTFAGDGRACGPSASEGPGSDTFAGDGLSADRSATHGPAGDRRASDRAASDGGLAAALDSALITLTGRLLAPRHDLVREAVCAAVPEATLRALHRRFAAHHLDAGQALLAAPHARAAATAGDVLSARILIAAAEELATASPGDAGDLAALAFRTMRPQQATWLELSRRCLSVLCRTQRAGEAVAVADAILAHVDDPDLAGAVESEAARALWLGGRLGELLARIGPRLDAGALTPAVGARLTAARALADTRLLTGGRAACEAAAALDLARASGDRDALALALHAVGEAARNEGRHQDALRSFRELRSLAGPQQLAEEVTALQFLDRYDHAQLLLDEVRSDCAATTGPNLPALHYAQMWQDFNLGRSDDAGSAARTLLDLGQQLGGGVYALDAVIVQISLALLRGDTPGAATLLVEADRLTDADDDVRRPGLTVMRGWLAAARGDVATALGVLGPVASGAVSTCSYWPLWPCWMGLFFEIGAAAADATFSSVVVQVAELAASRNPGVASFEGVALSLRGREKGDLAMLAESARVLARSPRPLLRAYGADRYGRALLAHGQREAALAQLDRAWDDYHRMDARVYRDDVQRVLTGAGARRPDRPAPGPRPDRGWDALTGAERRVARLIADGHSNRSAAGELGVSVNTVGTHLRVVFGKLGVQSRVQLANALHRTEVDAP
ncbi:helix-turn-helix transcriptional regulator [Streptacidiphilus anmyonensis]|uniref:helix-turn-helix transcriptional regulator n=1 Tax=Streptacidiphilus anmyonensis TaxID=405782 RepID=UPI0005AAFC1A|nr:AAA family ATPase [Streptacidiphilus anmyonensis]